MPPQSSPANEQSWEVTAIVNWRYSPSAHAAVALFGGALRPDVFETRWKGYPKTTWVAVDDIDGGYTAPLVKKYIEAVYLPQTLLPPKPVLVKRRSRSIISGANPSKRSRADVSIVASSPPRRGERRSMRTSAIVAQAASASNDAATSGDASAMPFPVPAAVAVAVDTS
jgi:hypothetical protein